MKAYGAIELTDASPAQSFAEPLTLSEIKTFLRITDSSPVDAEQDAMLVGFASAAREIAEIEQGVDLVVKQYDLHLDLLLGHDAIAGAAYPLRFNSIYNFGVGYEIELRHPLQSVDLFQHTNNDLTITTLVEDTDYKVDKNRSLVCPPSGTVWPFFTPDVTSAVLIRFTSGFPPTHPFWSNAGQRILIGMKMLITGWYDTRFPFVAGDVNEVPFGIRSLLGYGFRPRVH